MRDLYQSLFDWLLRKKSGRLEWIFYHFGRLSMQTLTRIYNPLVKYRLGDYIILFPASHNTPYLWKFNPENSLSLGRVAKIVTTKYTDTSIIDVGANIGDSAAIIRAHGVLNNIISIEGVKYFYDVLSRNAQKLGNVTVENAFIGHKSSSATVKVRILPTGNAVVYDRPEDYKVESVAAKSDSIHFTTLENIASSSEQVKLVKTDIEGFDLPVLMSSLSFIEEHKPLLFLELHISGVDEKSKGVSWRDLWSSLISMGYFKAIYWHKSSDFICSLDMDSDETEDLHSYYRNRWGEMYCDVCLIHKSDADLARKIRAAELSHASVLRPDSSSPL